MQQQYATQRQQGANATQAGIAEMQATLQQRLAVMNTQAALTERQLMEQGALQQAMVRLEQAKNQQAAITQRQMLGDLSQAAEKQQAFNRENPLVGEPEWDRLMGTMYRGAAEASVNKVWDQYGVQQGQVMQAQQQLQVLQNDQTLSEQMRALGTQQVMAGLGGMDQETFQYGLLLDQQNEANQWGPGTMRLGPGLTMSPIPIGGGRLGQMAYGLVIDQPDGKREVRVIEPDEPAYNNFDLYKEQNTLALQQQKMVLDMQKQYVAARIDALGPGAPLSSDQYQQFWTDARAWTATVPGLKAKYPDPLTTGAPQGGGQFDGLNTSQMAEALRAAEQRGLGQ